VNAAASAVRRPPPWRNVRVLRIAFQVAFLVVVVGVLWFLFDTLLYNLRRQGIRTDWAWLRQPAGFAIADTEFRSSQSFFAAYVTGARNTITVSALGIVLASLLGLVVGVARLSSNWLVRRTAALYVETFRNVPVLVIIFFLYFAVILRLPPIGRAVELGQLLVLSNRGLVVPWAERTGDIGVLLAVLSVGVAAAAAAVVWRTRRFDATGTPHRRVHWALAILALATIVGFFTSGRPYALSLPERGDLGVAHGFRMSPEYAGLLIALVLYTASHIAEIVRGSILAVPRGQSEAANALGLSELQRLRHVILPQALRIIVPPLANQYLNLTKNSSLGVVIAFPELTRVARISISQGAPAPQGVALLMLIYLSFSLTISLVANIANRRLAVKER
jgi:general L-amino acid transport system permease protein